MYVYKRHADKKKHVMYHAKCIKQSKVEFQSCVKMVSLKFVVSLDLRPRKTFTKPVNRKLLARNFPCEHLFFCWNSRFIKSPSCIKLFPARKVFSFFLNITEVNKRLVILLLSHVLLYFKVFRNTTSNATKYCKAIK